MSEHQIWSIETVPAPNARFSRSAAAVAAGSGVVVRLNRRLRRPWSPSSRMSLATRLRLVEIPWRRSSAWTLGAP